MSRQLPAEDLEDLYETAPCGYLSISPNGKIVKANRTLADWLGRNSDELIGESVHAILGFGGRIAFETHLAPLLRMQDHVHEIALDLLTVNGEKVPTIANAAEKRDASGRHQFTRLTLFKAVDRRTYERSLVEARVKAEAETRIQREATMLREQFMAVLGHDLRNPLAAIAALAGLMQLREQLSERALAMLDEIDGSVQRASALVNNLLDLAQVSLGGGFVADRDANAPLTPVLHQVLAEVRRIAPERQFDSSIDIEEPVYCDRGRIGQLASNLLSNAISHGSGERPIRLEAKTEGESFFLSVANAGAPIPEEVLAKLFQPFFRAATRPTRSGLGLGLYIASEIAEAHEGVLNVRSSDDETKFTFTMPNLSR